MARFEGIPNPQELRELKRAEIVRQASAIFAEKGFRGTSLTAVAKSVGVTKAALYHYVSGKEELLFLCQKAVVEQAYEIIHAAREAEGKSAFERLKNALSGIISAVTGDAIQYSLFFETTDELPTTNKEQVQEIKRLRDRVELQVRELVREAIDEGSLEPDTDPKLAGFMLLGSVIWVTRWFRQDGDWTREQIAEMVPRYSLQSFQKS